MARPIIEVSDLSKHYRLGQFNAGTMREEVEHFLRSFGRKSRDAQSKDRDFWALKNVSFSVQQGEVLGIIGRNGAGKSTLLKLLSRVTEPTAGQIRIGGRVASLLEVGTGFHPELTGRENIYLNGAILGMSRAETRSKFDEIVAFAEIDKFLDTPVKRYSSGMYVRLAFAVAAHLDPEILIIDEVLAVGDAAFQKRCIGKMQEISEKGGRTVIFVSHSLTSISALCQQGLLLKGGMVEAAGPIEDVLDAYTSRNFAGGKISMQDAVRSGGDQAAIYDAAVENGAGVQVNDVFVGEPFRIKLAFKADRVVRRPRFGFSIEDTFGHRVCSFSSDIMQKGEFEDASEGVAVCAVTMPRLIPGQYFVNLAVAESDGASVDYVERVLRFQVVPKDIFGTGKMFEPAHGRVFMDAFITLQQTNIDESLR